MIKLPFFGKSKTSKSSPRLLECVICFRKNTFLAAEVVDIAESNPAFTIAFWDDFDELIPFGENEKKKIISVSPEENDSTPINLTGEDQSNYLHFLHPSGPEKPQVMHWVFNSEKISALDSAWLNSLLTHKNFVVGYCGDKEDMLLQSTNIYQFYKNRGIKPLKTFRNEFGDLQVDVSQNPGKRKLVRGMWLMSCWRMWFGKNFYSVVPKERLSSFPSAHAIQQLENDVVLIELYEDPFKADDRRNRSVQKAFQEWVEMDRLERELA
jgi:hypothetical protein